MIDTLGILAVVAILSGLVTFVYFRTLRAGRKALIARRLGKASEQPPCVWADDPHPASVMNTTEHVGEYSE